jgi:hypothetical protein
MENGIYFSLIFVVIHFKETQIITATHLSPKEFGTKTKIINL